MMKMIVAAAAGMIVFAAGCGSPTTTTITTPAAVLQDDGFVAMLTQDGVPFKDHDDAVVMGQSVCVYLGQRGASIPSAVVSMLKWRPEFTGEQAGYAVSDAVIALCPEYKP